MEITVNLRNGKELEFSFKLHKDINMMVDVLKENIRDWSSMQIIIVNDKAETGN